MSENSVESCIRVRPADRLQRFFTRPFFLSLTIGVPFCLYKGLFGLAAFRTGTATSSPVLILFGWIVIAWAAIDLVMNALRTVFDLMHREAPIEYCSLAEMGRIIHRPRVFLAIDTLISFVIISVMLWSGLITALTVPESYLWYAATTLNLISLSVVSLYNEMKKAEHSP
ncbi:MAG: hypothetical protein LUQ31_04685 [Methanoregula sp.]|nr:hypothetical protein [Methanoregula sp.]